MTASSRLVSLDAYRGFIMLFMVSAGFGFQKVLRSLPAADPSRSGWETLVGWTSHVPWQGCSPWDLIQPAFMFMVGVAVPYSYFKRRQQGQGFWGMSWHAFSRALLLVLLGVFLATSLRFDQTHWLFTNVLAQIGLGYFFLFLFWRMGPEYEVSAILVILIGYWFFFFLHPVPGADFDWEAIGGRSEVGELSGLFAHWSQHTNAAAEFDRWFLNLFPRAEPFMIHPGGYQTLNFVPSLATMLAGSLTGRFLMRSKLSEGRKLLRLLIAAALCLLVGTLMGLFVCPIVKRIWTPSWVFFSTGWVLLMLAYFYALVDVRGWRRMVTPLVVVGTNSLFIYMLASLASGAIRERFIIHAPDAWFEGRLAPVIEQIGVMAVLWLLCFWLYRQRAFLRL